MNNDTYETLVRTVAELWLKGERAKANALELAAKASGIWLKPSDVLKAIRRLEVRDALTSRPDALQVLLEAMRIVNEEDETEESLPAIFDELGEIANKGFEGVVVAPPENRGEGPGYEDGRNWRYRPAYVIGRWHIQRHDGTRSGRWEATTTARSDHDYSRTKAKTVEGWIRNLYEQRKKLVKRGGIRLVDPDGNTVDELWLGIGRKNQDTGRLAAD